MSEKKFKWIIKEEVPPPRLKQVRPEYDECIDEFLESGFDEARVKIPNMKAYSLYAQLNKHIRKRGLKGKIRASVRKDKVYLKRIKTNKH